MLIGLLKTFIAAGLISLVSWLANKNTQLAGFLTALPLTSLIALLFTQNEWRDSATSVEFAQSIFYAVPVSLLFFIPFLFANKFKLHFWTCYVVGVLLLGVGYMIHSKLMKVMV